MPLPLIQYYRTQEPDDPRSDAEISDWYVQHYGPEKLVQEGYKDVVDEYQARQQAWRAEGRRGIGGLWEEARDGFLRGIDRGQAELASFGAGAAHALGLPTAEKWLLDQYKEQNQQAMEYPPTVPDVRKVQDPWQAALWAVGQVGEQGVNIGSSAAMAAAGTLVGGPVGTAAGLARAAGQTAGGVLGAAIPSYIQNQDYAGAVEQGANKDQALMANMVAGLPAAALDTILPLKIMKAVRNTGVMSRMLDGVAKVETAKVGAEAAKAGMGEIIKRFSTEVLKDSGLEASTEIAQEVINILSEVWANAGNANYKPPTNDEIFSRLINVGAAGAVLGVLGGAAESTVKQVSQTGIPTATTPLPATGATGTGIVASPVTPIVQTPNDAVVQSMSPMTKGGQLESLTALGNRFRQGKLDEADRARIGSLTPQEQAQWAAMNAQAPAPAGVAPPPPGPTVTPPAPAAVAPTATPAAPATPASDPVTVAQQGILGSLPGLVASKVVSPEQADLIRKGVSAAPSLVELLKMQSYLRVQAEKAAQQIKPAPPAAPSAPAISPAPAVAQPAAATESVEQGLDRLRKRKATAVTESELLTVDNEIRAFAKAHKAALPWVNARLATKITAAPVSAVVAPAQPGHPSPIVPLGANKIVKYGDLIRIYNPNMQLQRDLQEGMRSLGVQYPAVGPDYTTWPAEHEAALFDLLKEINNKFPVETASSGRSITQNPPLEGRPEITAWSKALGDIGGLRFVTPSGETITVTQNPKTVSATSTLGEWDNSTSKRESLLTWIFEKTPVKLTAAWDSQGRIIEVPGDKTPSVPAPTVQPRPVPEPPARLEPHLFQLPPTQQNDARVPIRVNDLSPGTIFKVFGQEFVVFNPAESVEGSRAITKPDLLAAAGDADPEHITLAMNFQDDAGNIHPGKVYIDAESLKQPESTGRWAQREQNAQFGNKYGIGRSAANIPDNPSAIMQELVGPDAEAKARDQLASPEIAVAIAGALKEEERVNKAPERGKTTEKPAVKSFIFDAIPADLFRNMIGSMWGALESVQERKGSLTDYVKEMENRLGSGALPFLKPLYVSNEIRLKAWDLAPKDDGAFDHKMHRQGLLSDADAIAAGVKIENDSKLKAYFGNVKPKPSGEEAKWYPGKDPETARRYLQEAGHLVTPAQLSLLTRIVDNPDAKPSDIATIVDTFHQLREDALRAALANDDVALKRVHERVEEVSKQAETAIDRMTRAGEFDVRTALNIKATIDTLKRELGRFEQRTGLPREQMVIFDRIEEALKTKGAFLIAWQTLVPPEWLVGKSEGGGRLKPEVAKRVSVRRLPDRVVVTAKSPLTENELAALQNRGWGTTEPGIYSRSTLRDVQTIQSFYKSLEEGGTNVGLPIGIKGAFRKIHNKWKLNGDTKPFEAWYAGLREDVVAAIAAREISQALRVKPLPVDKNESDATYNRLMGGSLKALLIELDDAPLLNETDRSARRKLKKLIMADREGRNATSAEGKGYKVSDYIHQTLYPDIRRLMQELIAARSLSQAEKDAYKTEAAKALNSPIETPDDLNFGADSEAMVFIQLEDNSLSIIEKISLLKAGWATGQMTERGETKRMLVASDKSGAWWLLALHQKSEPEGKVWRVADPAKAGTGKQTVNVEKFFAPETGNKIVGSFLTLLPRANNVVQKVADDDDGWVAWVEPFNAVREEYIRDSKLQYAAIRKAGMQSHYGNIPGEVPGIGGILANEEGNEQTDEERKASAIESVIAAVQTGNDEEAEAIKDAVFEPAYSLEIKGLIERPKDALPESKEDTAARMEKLYSTMASLGLGRVAAEIKAGIKDGTRKLEGALVLEGVTLKRAEEVKEALEQAGATSETATTRYATGKYKGHQRYLPRPLFGTEDKESVKDLLLRLDANMPVDATPTQVKAAIHQALYGTVLGEEFFSNFPESTGEAERVRITARQAWIRLILAALEHWDLSESEVERFSEDQPSLELKGTKQLSRFALTSVRPRIQFSRSELANLPITLPPAVVEKPSAWERTVTIEGKRVLKEYQAPTLPTQTLYAPLPANYPKGRAQGSVAQIHSAGFQIPEGYVYRESKRAFVWTGSDEGPSQDDVAKISQLRQEFQDLTTRYRSIPTSRKVEINITGSPFDLWREGPVARLSANIMVELDRGTIPPDQNMSALYSGIEAILLHNYKPIEASQEDTDSSPITTREEFYESYTNELLNLTWTDNSARGIVFKSLGKIPPADTTFNLIPENFGQQVYSPKLGARSRAARSLGQLAEIGRAVNTLHSRNRSVDGHVATGTIDAEGILDTIPFNVRVNENPDRKGQWVTLLMPGRVLLGVGESLKSSVDSAKRSFAIAGVRLSNFNEHPTQAGVVLAHMTPRTAEALTPILIRSLIYDAPDATHRAIEAQVFQRAPTEIREAYSFGLDLAPGEVALAVKNPDTTAQMLGTIYTWLIHLNPQLAGIRTDLHGGRFGVALGAFGREERMAGGPAVDPGSSGRIKAMRSVILGAATGIRVEDLKFFVEDMAGHAGNATPLETTRANDWGGIFTRTAEEAEGYRAWYPQMLPGQSTVIFKAAVNALAEMGVNVDIFSSAIPNMEGAQAGYVDNHIALVMADMANATPEHLVHLLHEVGHHLFWQLPTKMQAQLHEAISRVSDEVLGLVMVHEGVVARYQTRETKTDAITRDRLVEAVAIRLANHGWNPDEARSMIQAIWDTIQQAYRRIAMWVAQAVLDFKSVKAQEYYGRLAMEYFEGRVKNALRNPQSFVAWLGGPKPDTSRQIAYHLQAVGGGERIAYYDAVEDRWNWPAAVTESAEDADYTIYASGETERYGMRTMEGPQRAKPLQQIDIASLNETLAHVQALYKGVSIAYSGVMPSGINTLNKFMVEMGIKDPVVARTKYLSNRALKGLPAISDSISIDELPVLAWKQTAAKAALARGYNLREKLASTAAERKDTIEKSRKKLVRLREKQAMLSDWYHDGAERGRQIQDGVRDLVHGFAAEARHAVELGSLRGGIAETLQGLNRQMDRPQIAHYAQALNDITQQVSSVRWNLIMEAINDFGMNDQWATMTPEAIRDELQSRIHTHGALNGLAEPTLMDTVVAFIRTNQIWLDMMHVALTLSVTERATVNQVIREAMRGTAESVAEANRLIAQLPVKAAMAQRIFDKLSRSNRLIKLSESAIARDEQYIDVRNKGRTALGEALAKLEKSVFPDARLAELRPYDGLELFDPKTADQNDEDVLSAPKFKYRIEWTNQNVSSSPEMRERMKRWKEWLVAHENQRGILYNTIEEQLNLLSDSEVNKVYQHLTVGNMRWRIASLRDRLNFIGLPQARLAANMLNKSDFWQDSKEREIVEAGFKGSVLKSHAAKALTMRPDHFERAVMQYGKGWLQEHAPELATLSEDDRYKRFRNAFARNAETEPATRDAVWPTIRKVFEAEVAQSKRLNELRRGVGLGVKDEFGNQTVYRDTIGDPMFTWTRSPAKHLRSMFDLMREPWSLERGTKGEDGGVRSYIKTLRETVKNAQIAGPEAVKAVEESLRALFRDPGNRIWTEFLIPLAETENTFLGPAPVTVDALNGEQTVHEGARDVVPVEVALAAAQAAGGDIIAFIDDLHKRMGGPAFEDRLSYIVSSMENFFQFYRSIEQEFEDFEARATMRRMWPATPHIIMDARRSESWAKKWLRFLPLDQNNGRFATREMIYHGVFGRNGEAFAKLVAQIEADLQASASNYEMVRLRVAGEHPEVKGAALRKLIAAEARKLEFDPALLEQSRDNLSRAQAIQTDFDAVFHRHIREIPAWQEALFSVTGHLIQGPKTSLFNTFSMFDPWLVFGLGRSTLAIVRGAWRRFFFQEATGSFMEMFLQNVTKNTGYAEARIQLGYPSDFGASAKGRVEAERYALNEYLDRETRSSYFTRLVTRTIPAALMTRIKPRIEPGQGKFAPVSPFRIFTMIGKWMHTSMIDELWASYTGMLIKAIQFVKANPEATEADMTPEALGFKHGWILHDDKVFEKMLEKINERGINLFQVAKSRAGEDVTLQKSRAPSLQVVRQLWNQEQLRAIASIAMSELILDSSVINRPPGLLGNPVLRVAAPLISWSIGRTGQIANAFRGADHERNYATIMTGLLAVVGTILPMTLVYSLMADWYDERIIGRKLNRRRLSSDDIVASYLENVGNLGSMGLWGDVPNGVFNFMHEGNPRGISVDGRVVVLRTLYQFGEALRSLVLQRGETSYATVTRPLIQATGGAGYLQYVEAMNHLISPQANFGLGAGLGGLVGTAALGPVGGLALGAAGAGLLSKIGESELEFTRKLNVDNYLRAAGRAAGVEIMTSAGLRTLPTITKPSLGQMVQAALANDPNEFKEAYARAIEAARDEGKPDAEDFVARAFAARHPLATVFKTRPSVAELKQIAAHIEPVGQDAVREAIRLLDHYGAQIGSPAYRPRTEPLFNAPKRHKQISAFQRGGGVLDLF